MSEKPGQDFINERKVFKYMRVDDHIILGKDERKKKW